MRKGARKAGLGAVVLAALLGSGSEFPAALGRGQAPSNAAAAPKSVLLGARLSYYNLHSRGMASFQCDVAPDWDLVLGDMSKTNPDAAKNVLLLLQQLHFNFSVAPDDTAKVTHTGLEEIKNQDVQKGLSQIYGGVEQMVTGMFATWSLFMLKTPFPNPDSEYKLVDQGEQYQLKYKDAGADVVAMFGHDYAIHSMEVTLPNLYSSIAPILTSTPEGFVVAGYDATSKMENPANNTELHVHLEYTKVQGLEMLSRLTMNGNSGSTPFNMAMGFMNCKATMK